MKRGFVVVASAPSGTGKTSIRREVIRRNDGKIIYSVSATSRPKRPNEVEGQDYIFLTQEEFHCKIEANEFLEWTYVYGHYYGTFRKIVEDALAREKVLFMELDVRGAKRIKQFFPDSVLIFVAPPSLETLRERLKSRGGEAEEIERRLASARKEMEEMAKEFTYLVVNRDLETSIKEVEAIITAERCRMERNSEELALLGVKIRKESLQSNF